MSNKNKNQKPQATKKPRKGQEEVVQELPKNPMEYTYRGDEDVVIPASLFLKLYRANDAAVAQGTKGQFPPAFMWVSVATGMEVKDPKEIDIKEGRVVQTMSVERTFGRENYVETFEPWLFPDIIQAKDEMIKIHTKNVNEGICIKITELEAERKKAQAEAIKQAQEAAKKAQEEGPTQEGPQKQG